MTSKVKAAGAAMTSEVVFVGHRDAFEDMSRVIATAKIRPVIEEVFPFDRAHDAYRAFMRGTSFGKIVISRDG